jgi:hypothetical protein
MYVPLLVHLLPLPLPPLSLLHFAICGWWMIHS